MKRIDPTLNCQYCSRELKAPNLKRHKVACFENPANYRECPVCEKQIMNKDNLTCSTGCANTLLRTGTDNPNYNPDGRSAHRVICFEHHNHECIICEEKRIVAVHHYDEDNSNNDPKNLIPLCPTCHQVFHSRWRSDVEQRINDYHTSV